MASKQAKVRCPHCSVEFGFALPQKYVDGPKKNLKFICEYCTERFSVFVSDLFSEDGTELASLKIRHQSVDGLRLYSSWEEVIQSHFGEPIEESDPMSAFGKEWKPASMFEELSTIFPNADILDSTNEDSVEAAEDVVSEENVVSESTSCFTLCHRVLHHGLQHFLPTKHERLLSQSGTQVSEASHPDPVQLRLPLGPDVSHELMVAGGGDRCPGRFRIAKKSMWNVAAAFGPHVLC